MEDFNKYSISNIHEVEPPFLFRIKDILDYLAPNI